jgi:hypothetical protein
VGLFGSLSVPAIVVVFTVPTPVLAENGARTAFAIGLLVIGMFGSILGAVGLAAIGAERDPTANLAVAIMLIAIPTVLSIAAVLAAFEVLAVLYVPDARMIFTLITGAGGIFGLLFNAYSVSDSVGLGPKDPEEHELWLKTQWLTSRANAYRWGQRVAIYTALPLAVATVLKVVIDFRVSLNATGINILIGIGILLTLLGTFLSVGRTAHPVNGPQMGVRPIEAFGTNIVISLYVTALIICLP